MKNITIELSFFDDLSRIAAKRIEQRGHVLPADVTPEGVFHLYFNLLKRHISVQPRQVFIAKGFVCPPIYEEAFQDILRKLRAGEDLLPRQSRRIAEADFDDKLLNHWGIHHLHLSLEPDPKAKRHGLLKGTPELLFLRVTPEAVYIIGIYDHNAWTQQALIEVIHANWPESVEHYHVKGIMQTGLSDENYATLRKQNLNAFIVMKDGTVYTGMGGGTVMSGLSMEVVVTTDRLRARCTEFEEAVRQTLVPRLMNMLGADGKTIDFVRLVVLESEGEFMATSTSPRITARLPDLKLPWF